MPPRVFFPEFRQAYARAREDRTEIWAEQMLDIALDGSRDYDKDGKLRKESVLRSKLIIETMQWQMVRLDPRLWSEKKRVEASVQTTVAAMPPEQREAMVQGILKRLGLEEQRAKKSRIVHVTPKPEPATVAAPKKGAIRR